MATIQIDQSDFEILKKDAENYKELSKLFFEKNFGSASKSSIKLLMFHQFILKEEQSNVDSSLGDVIKYGRRKPERNTPPHKGGRQGENPK